MSDRGMPKEGQGSMRAGRPETPKDVGACGPAGREQARIPPFAALRAFEAFGRSRSIRKAAADLSLHHAVVTRHIAALERWTGTCLIDRTERVLRLTPPGEVFHARIAAAIAGLADATAELIRPASRQRLSIWANGGFSAKWLGPRMVEFAGTHPWLEIELRPTDRVPDLLRSEADVDLRFYGHAYAPSLPPHPGVRHLTIATPPIMVVGAPSLVARLRGRPPLALLQETLLHEEHDEQWRAWFVARGISVPSLIAGPRLWHAHIALEAAVNGKGLALASLFLVQDELRDGRLVAFRPADDPAPPPSLGSYVFCSREDRWNDPVVARLRNWLQGQADLLPSERPCPDDLRTGDDGRP